jgi:hypothetical protein
MYKIILVFFLLFAISIISLYNYKYRNSTEYFDITTPLSNEAIQNIASVYNANNLTATNITVTGALTGGTTNITGTSHFTGMGNDTWFPYTDGKNYIRGPLQIDGATNVASSITVGGLKVSPGTASPDSAFIDFGDGTGWRLRARNNKGTTLVDFDDNGNMKVSGNITSGGNTISPQYFNISMWADANGTTDSVPTKCYTSDPSGYIVSTACNKNDANQLFYWNGNKIFNKATNMCLDLDNPAYNKTSNLVLRSPANTGNQNWLNYGNFGIRNFRTHQCIDSGGTTAVSGKNNLIMYPCNNGNYQIFMQGYA